MNRINYEISNCAVCRIAIQLRTQEDWFLGASSELAFSMCRISVSNSSVTALFCFALRTPVSHEFASRD